MYVRYTPALPAGGEKVNVREYTSKVTGKLSGFSSTTHSSSTSKVKLKLIPKLPVSTRNTLLLCAQLHSMIYFRRDFF